jgi:hypothetical protein
VALEDAEHAARAAVARAIEELSAVEE